MEFELPQDLNQLSDAGYLTALTDENLADALTLSAQAFATLSARDQIDDDGLASMRALAGGSEAIRAEQTARRTAAEAAAAEIDAMAARVRGEDPNAPAAGVETAAAGDASAEGQEP
ncbi:cell wall protein, partial [Streptomyces fuscigenes]|nr:cell wall protein [Streptomyces fuscigenes]